MTKRSRLALHVYDIHPRRIGGVERQLHEISRQLRKANWDFLACMPSGPRDHVAKYMREVNAEVIAVPEIFAGGVDAFRRMYALVREYRPEVVHFSFVSGLSLLPWAAKAAGAHKVLLTDTCSRPEGYRPVAAKLMKRTIGRAIMTPIDHFVSPSDYLLRCNTEAGYCAAGKQTRIYNSAPVNAAGEFHSSGKEFRERFQIPADRVVVTQVTWLIPEKGVFDLLRTAQLAVQQDPRLHFVIVGDGRSRAELETLTRELNLGEHVTFTGLVIDPIAEGVFAATDIACHFARWEEAFGLVIAEAMSQGKPLVGSRCGALPELILEGETGFLVPVGDTQALAERILTLAAFPELREKMGEAGRQRAGSNFSLAKNIRHFLDLYGCPAPGSVVERTAVYAQSSLIGP